MSVTALIIGGGNRGSSYAAFSLDHPSEFEIVAIAEPREKVRERLCKTYCIDAAKSFAGWKDALKVSKFADVAIIATPDRFHKEPAIAAAQKGYHVLLEKPMAPSQEECEEIYSACSKAGVIMRVCHVLRYTEQTVLAKQLIIAGFLGSVVNIQLIEPVGFWHFAHSFVRGNWRREDESAPALLAKSCHDLDLIQYWMGEARCTAVSSFGSLTHFKPEDKPQAAGSHCLNCAVEQDCPYSAKRLYLQRARKGLWGWPVSVVTEGEEKLDLLEERLRTGSYGRCVYECDNDVCSHQVVNLEFDGNQTASFSMVAFTEKLCVRQVRIHGTKGQLEFDLDGTSSLKRYDFLKQEFVEHSVGSLAEGSRLSGHGGADYCLMRSFVDAVKANDRSIGNFRDSLASHMLVFAAEHARKSKSVVRLEATGPDGVQSPVV